MRFGGPILYLQQPICCAQHHFFHPFRPVGSQPNEEPAQQAELKELPVHPLRQTFAGSDHVLIHVGVVKPAIVPRPEHRKVQVTEDLRFR